MSLSLFPKCLWQRSLLNPQNPSWPSLNLLWRLPSKVPLQLLKLRLQQKDHLGTWLP